MCNKYSAPKKKENEMLTPCEEIINNMHSKDRSDFLIPEFIYKNHPSILRMNVLPQIVDLSVPKRMLACVIAALKANGMIIFFMIPCLVIFTKFFKVHVVDFVKYYHSIRI